MLINKELIVLHLKATSKNDAITELATLAQQQGKIISLADYTNSVFEREKTYSTGVGNGIAIPHGKSKGVKEAMIVFGKSDSGIEWNSTDGNPVTMIFLLGVPEESVDNLHLKVLSQLSRKLMDDDFIALLHQASTTEEVLSTLSDIQVG